MTTQPRVRAGIELVLPGRRLAVLAMVAAIVALSSLSVASVGVSLAAFKSQTPVQALFGTKALFPNEHVTPAFDVADSSSGSETDRSNPYAVAGDGLTTTTTAWSAAFAAGRYVEFDLNNSLASGVAVTGATFTFSVASSGAGTACFYFEVRRISTGAVLATHGSSGTPVGCVTGTTQTSFATAVPSVATTSIADDLRIRVYGRESGSASMVIDVATVDGSTAYQDFTLFPVIFRDAADTTPDVIPWELSVP